MLMTMKLRVYKPSINKYKQRERFNKIIRDVSCVFEMDRIIYERKRNKKQKKV